MELTLVFNQVNKPDIYGFFAALLTTIAFIPQVVKTWKTKSAKDVSFVMLFMFLSGVLLWIVYAWKINALPVLLANIITFALNLSILTLKIIYSRDLEVNS